MSKTILYNKKNDRKIHKIEKTRHYSELNCPNCDSSNTQLRGKVFKCFDCGAIIKGIIVVSAIVLTIATLI